MHASDKPFTMTDGHERLADEGCEQLHEMAAPVLLFACPPQSEQPLIGVQDARRDHVVEHRRHLLV
jgi:hypothetical protein